MFKPEKFLKDNLIRGYMNGSFTAEQVSIFAYNYCCKGDISENCFNELKEMVEPEEADLAENLSESDFHEITREEYGKLTESEGPGVIDGE